MSPSGFPAQPGMQGINLEPLIKKDSQAQKHEVIFSEYLETEEAMVRSNRYKLIVGTGNKPRRDGYQPAKSVLGPYQKLYDLIEDPAENHDLGHNPRYDSVREQLTLAMYQRFVTTWNNPEPIPAGLSPLQTVHWCLVPRDK
jgi:arylsulfatase A-like enzyme